MEAFLLGAAAVVLLRIVAPPPVDETVVLLPGPDGKVGKVIVERRGERALLEHAYAAAHSTGAGGVRVERRDGAQVRREFEAVLDALPARPTSYVVYFKAGLDELTDESKAMMQRVLAELRGRPQADVVVVGHTDRVATDEWNDMLSLQRAERVKAEIVALGIAAGRVRTAGRGEREPLVPTADGVEEPRNRRVVISVR